MAQLTELKKAAASSKNRNVNKILEPSRIFIWKGAIEEVIVPSKATDAAEIFMQSKGLLNANSNQSDRRNNVLKAVKELTHRPEIMIELIEYLWVEGFYKQQEIMKALTYALN